MYFFTLIYVSDYSLLLYYFIKYNNIIDIEHEGFLYLITKIFKVFITDKHFNFAR